MKWGLRLDRAAVQDLYKIGQPFVALIWVALNALTETPDSNNLQPDEDDPSVYWVAIEGDFVIHFEILDAEHVIRVLRIK